MAVGKRIVTLFEILIVTTLFAMFAGIVITSHTNDAIISHTEEFVEMVRYKGCITKNTYDDFLKGFDTPVEVNIQVTRKPQLSTPGALNTVEMTQDVVNTMAADANGLYRMNVGDEIQVIVRKPSGNLYNTLIGSITGQYAAGDKPAIAIKGGMILNTQYD